MFIDVYFSYKKTMKVAYNLENCKSSLLKENTSSRWYAPLSSTFVTSWQVLQTGMRMELKMQEVVMFSFEDEKG